MSIEKSNVPILDMARPLEELATACRQACETHGFFYISNHGVPSETIDKHAKYQKSFFSLSLEQKMKIVADHNNRGYTPLGNETLDPKASRGGDLKEGLYFGREVEKSELPLHGPNQWPAESLLPGYRAAVEDYMDCLTRLGYRLLPLIALSLNLSQDYFLPYFSESPMIFLRPLHYPPIPSSEAAGIFAAGAHSDYGFLTILWTDGTPGLQIYMESSGWMDVEPLPDTFIVNLGDMLERWTGGRFASTRHRVINTAGKERYSCAFFFEPSFTSIVSPIPLPEDDQEEAKNEREGTLYQEKLQRYPPIMSGAYLLEKYAATQDKFSIKAPSN